MKLDFRYESLRIKSVLFFLLKKDQKNYLGNAFEKEQKKKKPGFKFNPGLALICLRTTVPWSFS